MTRWYERPFTAFDLETSGTDLESDRIVTAAIVRVDPVTGKTDVREWLSDVAGEEIPAEATEIHKVTTAHAREHGEPAAKVVHEIASVLGGAWMRLEPVVIYNGCFDLTILDRELRRHFDGMTLDPAAVVDPFVIDKHYDRYRKGSRKLIDTAKHYGVELSEQDAHGATADALAAARVAWKLARVFPELAEMRLPELHAKQITWYAEQSVSFRDYLTRQRARAVEPDEITSLDARIASITTGWPLRPAVAAVPEPVGGES